MFSEKLMKNTPIIRLSKDKQRNDFKFFQFFILKLDKAFLWKLQNCRIFCLFKLLLAKIAIDVLNCELFFNGKIYVLNDLWMIFL